MKSWFQMGVIWKYLKQEQIYNLQLPSQQESGMYTEKSRNFQKLDICKNKYSRNFQKLAIRENKYSPNTIFFSSRK